MAINYWQHFEENSFYHIYNHSVSDKNIFNSQKDSEDFIIKFYRYLDCVFDVLAYCLMPNHFHFIVRVKEKVDVLKLTKNEISQASQKLHNDKFELNDFILDQFRRFFSSYAISYNKRNSQSGQLFLKRFKRVELIGNRINYMVCYVHHNPIHHNFRKDYESWKYSSYRLYMENHKNLSRLIDFNVFENRKDFINSHNIFKLDKEDNLGVDL